MFAEISHFGVLVELHAAFEKVQVMVWKKGRSGILASRQQESRCGASEQENDSVQSLIIFAPLPWIASKVSRLTEAQCKSRLLPCLRLFSCPGEGQAAFLAIARSDPLLH